MKRTLCVFVCLIMILGMMPFKASAAQDVTVEQEIMNGYYQDGTWVAGELVQTLPAGIDEVSKTAVKIGDNEFRITLTVETSQTVSVVLPEAAATVLVIDTSGSMADSGKLTAAKQAAKDFIASYRGDHSGIGRYIAIVDFSNGVSTALNWTDVSTASGNQSAISTINSLSANGGTNLHAGLYLAKKMFGRPTVSGISKAAKNVVVLTDGAPTYALKAFSGSLAHWFPDITIDGEEFDLIGNGKAGSKTINDATQAAATALAGNANIFTVCYGAAKDYTYKNGPTVGDFLKNSVASSTGNAYNIDNADELAAAFKAISDTITAGLNGNGLTVTDQTKKHLILSGLPTGTEQTEEGFTWELKDPVTRTEGDTTYYTYTLEYTVKHDADAVDFVEGEWYPLNGETALHIPDPDGGQEQVVNFPIPAGKGVKSRYTVTFVDEDGTELQKETDVVHGTTPTYKGETPTKEATDQYTYSFAGWTPNVVPATKDAVYTATYTETTNTYKVTWEDEDGTKLEEDENVPYGTMPSFDGETPTKEGTAQYTYSFDGWTPSIAPVTADQTYTAVYRSAVNQYTVTWVNYDNSVLETDSNVDYGTMPNYNGETPKREKTAQTTYTFAGWTPTVEAVTKDVVYTAAYTETTNSYTVRWVDEEGNELEVDENVLYGTMPSFDSEQPTKEATDEFTYSFQGWSPEVGLVTGDITYTAVFDNSINLYTVTWVNYDNTVLEKDEDVPYGKMPSFESAEPTKEANAQYSYSFAGWNPAVDTVKGNTTYTAQYTESVNAYFVTFVDEDGTLLQQEQLDFGSMPSFKQQEPTKAATAEYSYTFGGWTPAVTAVTSDQIYVASYVGRKNTYVITWVDEDGTVLETDEAVEFGDMPVFNGDVPTKEATPEFTYFFDQWLPEVAAVSGDATYTVAYKEERNTYKVTWINEDGTELETDEHVPYGSLPTYDGKTPVKAETEEAVYTFEKWDPEISPVTGDVTHKAVYKETKKEKPVEESTKPKDEPKQDPPAAVVTTVPKTGESENASVWIVFGMAVMGALGLAFAKKRSLHHEK